MATKKKSRLEKLKAALQDVAANVFVDNATARAAQALLDELVHDPLPDIADFERRAEQLQNECTKAAKAGS